MDILGEVLTTIGGIGSLVCFVLVLIQMFQRGRTGLAIACIVLLFCCGIGGVVAFIYGWVKHREWGLTNVMAIWTGCWILSAVGYVLHPVDVRQFQSRLPGP
jgi:hypothetical protein